MNNMERDGNGVAIGDRILITDRSKNRCGQKGTIVSYTENVSLDRRTYGIRYNNGGTSEFYRRRFKILTRGLCGYCKWGCAVEDKEECPFYEEEGSE